MTNKQSFSNKLILFGYMCLPVFLISGPFLSDLFVVLICIYFFLFEDFKSIFLNFKKEIYFFLIFLVYLNLNTFFVSDHFFVSLKVTLPYLRFLIFLVFTAYLLSRAEYLKEYILYSCLVCFFCLFLDSLYQFYNGTNILGFAIHNMRVSSFFGDELVLGSFTSRIIIIILSLFLVVKKFENNKKLLYFLILFIGYCLIFLSNERTALLNFITILICFSFIEFRLKNFFLIILTFILINISIFLIYPKNLKGLFLLQLSRLKLRLTS